MHDKNCIDAASAERFVRTFANAQPSIFRFVQTLLPSVQDAEEVVQETSVVLWKKWSEYDPEKNFVTWACGVARLEVFRYLRGQPKVLHLSEDVLTHIADLALDEARQDSRQSDSMDALNACLGELSSKDSNLLTMRYRRGIAVVDIAEEVGLAKSTVFETLKKIRARLMRCVERRLKIAEGA